VGGGVGGGGERCVGLWGGGGEIESPRAGAGEVLPGVLGITV